MIEYSYSLENKDENPSITKERLTSDKSRVINLQNPANYQGQPQIDSNKLFIVNGIAKKYDGEF